MMIQWSGSWWGKGRPWGGRGGEIYFCNCGGLLWPASVKHGYALWEKWKIAIFIYLIYSCISLSSNLYIYMIMAAMMILFPIPFWQKWQWLMGSLGFIGIYGMVLLDFGWRVLDLLIYISMGLGTLYVREMSLYTSRLGGVWVFNSGFIPTHFY